MKLKEMVCAVLGSVGGAITAVFGGWSFGPTALLILMGIDYISGLVVAGVFHKSPKTQNGTLESHAGLKGLIRKFFVVCLVVAAHLIDRLIGTQYIRDAVTIAFCVNEIISLFENAGLMGVPLPKALVKALEVLKQRSGEDGGELKVENGKLKVESDGGTDSSPAAQNDRERDMAAVVSGHYGERDVEAPSPTKDAGDEILRCAHNDKTEDGGRPMTAPTGCGGAEEEDSSLRSE